MRPSADGGALLPDGRGWFEVLQAVECLKSHPRFPLQLLLNNALSEPLCRDLRVGNKGTCPRGGGEIRVLYSVCMGVNGHTNL